MSYQLGKRSLSRLEGVHPSLVKVVKRAIQITEVDFTVLEGLRSYKRQVHLKKTGKSQTLNSRHLSGHAVDLGAYEHGAVSWSWPSYHKIAEAIKQAATELEVDIQWGGDWRTFKDGPHWELTWKSYPKQEET